MRCERDSNETIIRLRRDELGQGWPLLRLLAFIRDRWQCVYCQRSMFRDNVPLHLDHVQSVARGGTNRLENLVTACASCNLSKGADDLTPPLLNEVRKTTWGNSDMLYRASGAGIPPIEGRPVYESPDVRTESELKHSRLIAEWIALDIRQGLTFTRRPIGRLLCLRCDNDFPAVVVPGGAHESSCPWNYYTKCLYCQYENNIAKYLSDSTRCVCTVD